MVLLSIIALAVAFRLALNPLAAHFTQRGLDSITGYKGSFSEVAVSVLPPGLVITDLKLVQDGTDAAEPALFVKELRARVIGRKLLKGQLVALAGLYKAKSFIKAGETEAPPEAKRAAREGVEELERHDFDVSQVLRKVVPLRVDRVEIRNSELVLIDATDPKLPRFWVDDIELVVDNIATRPELDEGVPLTITMRAVVQRTGILKVLASANLLAEDKPAFTGQAQLSGLKLQSLYEWAAAKAGVSPRGAADLFVNFDSARGRVSGAVKVMIRNAVIEPATKELSDGAKALFANMAIKVLSDRVEGREAIVTTLPIQGRLTSPDPQVWPSILGVVRNAFVQGLDWGFSDLPPERAPVRKGLFEQAGEALDKEEPGPKAQPGPESQPSGAGGAR